MSHIYVVNIFVFVPNTQSEYIKRKILGTDGNVESNNWLTALSLALALALSLQCALFAFFN